MHECTPKMKTTNSSSRGQTKGWEGRLIFLYYSRNDTVQAKKQESLEQQVSMCLLWKRLKKILLLQFLFRFPSQIVCHSSQLNAVLLRGKLAKNQHFQQYHLNTACSLILVEHSNLFTIRFYLQYQFSSFEMS